MVYLFILGAHTGENLRRQLEGVMASFNIAEKLVGIVTDNASNNIRAFEELTVPGFEAYFDPEDDDEEEASGDDEPRPEARSDDTNIDEQEGHLRIPCFAHTLQLSVSDGLKECSSVKSAIEKVASIAKLR